MNKLAVLFLVISTRTFAQDPVDRLVDYLKVIAESPNPVGALLADRGHAVDELRQLLVPFGYRDSARALEARVHRLATLPSAIFCCSGTPKTEKGFTIREIPRVVEYFLNPQIQPSEIVGAQTRSVQRGNTLVGLEVKSANLARGTRLVFLEFNDPADANALLNWSLETNERSGVKRVTLQGQVPVDHPSLAFSNDTPLGFEIEALDFGLPTEENLAIMAKSPAGLRTTLKAVADDKVVARNPEKRKRFAAWYSKHAPPIPADRLTGLNHTMTSEVAAIWLEQSIQGDPTAQSALEKLRTNTGEKFYREALVNAAIRSTSPHVRQHAEGLLGGAIAVRIEALGHPNEEVAWSAVRFLHARQIPVPADKVSALERLAEAYVYPAGSKRRPEALHSPAVSENLRLLTDLLLRTPGCAGRVARATKTHVDHSQPKDD